MFLAFLTLIYSHTFFAILFSFFIAICLLKAISLKTKHDYSFSSSIGIAIIVYFSFQFSPLPPLLNGLILESLTNLEKNKVDSNGMRNTVLYACQREEGQGLRGFEFERVMEWYLKDLNNHSEKHPSITFPTTEKLSKDKSISRDDLCKAASVLNDQRIARLYEENPKLKH